MARRSKKLTVDERHPAYRVVFSLYPAMQQRLAHVLEHGTDPSPGLTSCRNLELCVEDLAAGRPAPLGVGELNGAVEQAMRELFALRDMRAVS